MKKIVLFLILSLFLIYFFLTFLLNSLFRITTFLSRIFWQPTTVEKENNLLESFLLVDVVEIPMATNSSRINFTLNLVNGDKLLVYLNDEKIDEIRSNEEIIQSEISGLKEGKNYVYFVAIDSKTNTKKKSKEFEVIFKKKPPKLVINFPNENQELSKNEIIISGETDPETIVKVNNLPAVIDNQGRFNFKIFLSPGNNEIIITAEDIAGNLSEKKLNVVYNEQ